MKNSNSSEQTVGNQAAREAVIALAEAVEAIQPRGFQVLGQILEDSRHGLISASQVD